MVQVIAHVLGRAVTFAVIWATVALASMSGANAAADPAQLRDAQAYAARFGVDPAMALLRLSQQAQAGALQAELQSAYPSTFAGLWLEHQPFAVKVAFTRGGAAALARHIGTGPLKGVAVAVEADRSLSELNVSIDALVGLARAAPVELSINVPENAIDVFVTAADVLDEATRRTGIQLPANAVVRVIPSLSRPQADIYGGLGLSTCTSGYGIIDLASFNRGVTTAGHCDTTQSYLGTNLPYQSSRRGGSHDEQWHTAPGFQVRNLVRDSVGTRQITAVVPRSSQAAGMFVCKYGKTTGFGCTTIASTSYLPSSGCVPNAFATFISMKENITLGGDSGAPWYIQNEAYGQHVCGAPGTFSVYVAADYVESGLGVEILTSP